MRRLPVTSVYLVLLLFLVGCGSAASPTPAQTPGPTDAAPGTVTAAPAAPATVGPGTPSPSPVAAATASATEVPDRALVLSLGDRTWRTTVRELGFRPDPAGGLRLTGDAAGLTELLAKIDREVQQPARDARVRILADGTWEHTAAQEGRALDVEAARARLDRAAVDGAERVELPTRSVPPARGDDLVAAARDRLARILPPGEGPLVTMRAAERSWEFDRAEIAAMLALAGHDKPGTPVTVVLDEAPVRELLKRIGKAVDRPAQNARFAWNGGDLKLIRESKPGRVLDQEAALARLDRALLGGEREIELPVGARAAPVPDDPGELGIVELIERGSTSMAGAIPEKKHNIKLAAERLNGVVVPPGGIFSFNQEVGPTTLEAGYKWGFGITSSADGIKTVPSVAGGICQVATTLFQPVFWAGYALEERYWHLYWIPSYTSRDVVGLDVTVDEASGLDFKWMNPTANHVLIQASADDDRVTFALYGKKPKWTVKVDPAKITNRVPPDTKPVYEEEPSLPWGRTVVVEAARDGFDAEVVRNVVPADGGEPRTLTLKSSYQPSRNVTLIGTAGKPANASVDDVIARLGRPAAPAATPAVGRPGATPSTGNRPAPTPSARPSESGGAATPAPGATQAPAATPAGPVPTPGATQPAPGATPGAAGATATPRSAGATAPTATPRPAGAAAPTVTPRPAGALPPTVTPARPAATATPLPAATKPAGG